MENRHQYLVEECFALTPKTVCRFNCVEKSEINSLEHGPGINYWFDDDNGSTCLFVSIGGQEPQKFNWELVLLTFGERAYFYCSCGHRASKLYLPPNGTEFKCRKCHNLKYELSTFNRKSLAGQSLYQANRLLKLANSRANISRIFYNGNFTKRFERFLKLCDRAGLDSVVKGAQDLKALTKG